MAPVPSPLLSQVPRCNPMVPQQLAGVRSCESQAPGQPLQVVLAGRGLSLLDLVDEGRGDAGQRVTERSR